MRYVGDYDVVVAGAGTAGCVAAVAAARNGARTLLVEKNGFLGGTPTAAMVSPFLSFHNMRGEQIAEGIPQEIVDRLLEKGGAIPPGHLFNPYGNAYTVTPNDPEILKLVHLEMTSEAGVDLLLHTYVFDTLVEDGRARGLHMANKWGRATATGTVIIDCTGDADVAASSGAPWVKGRAEDGLTMAMTVFFRLGNVDMEPTLQFMKERPDQFLLAEDPYIKETPEELMKRVKEPKDVPLITGFFDLIKEKHTTNEFPKSRQRLIIAVTPTPGLVAINTASVLKRDATDAWDLTQAEIEGRMTVQQLYRFFRKYIAGFEDCFLLDTGTVIGIRESRRIVGEYTVTFDDVVNGREFRDSIGRGAYCIDVHEPDGTIRHAHIKDGKAYTIPYRSLVPQEVDGLLVAGRCISVERDAMGATREQVPCMIEGQAAGTAAAMCASEGIAPRSVDTNELRRVLESQGVIV
jgi:hypothetical protein